MDDMYLDESEKPTIKAPSPIDVCHLGTLDYYAYLCTDALNWTSSKNEKEEVEKMYSFIPQCGWMLKNGIQKLKWQIYNLRSLLYSTDVGYVE